MTESWEDVNIASTSTSISSRQPHFPQFSSASTPRCGGSNVFRLLVWREISPRAKHLSKRLWRDTSKPSGGCTLRKIEATDARHGLNSWVEAESLWHISAKYCPLLPPPRSTIAAAFSHDGKTLASTHGDHTVKIIDCYTGRCLKVLSGHQRTPWVVRFHPVDPKVLASGSLDHEVRLWNANTAECIGSHDFYRPIASIAFHAQGEVLAVASGHKLFIWHYNKRGSLSSPVIVLKTRRSLRAVHFHPHAAPFLLTAEVNDIDNSDCPMTLATSLGYLHYPPPTVLFANAQNQAQPNVEEDVPLVSFPCLFSPSFAGHHGRTSLQNVNRAFTSTNGQPMDISVRHQVDSNSGNLHNHLISPMEMSPVLPSSSNQLPQDMPSDIVLSEMENLDTDFVMGAVESSDRQDADRVRQIISPSTMEISNSTNNISPVTLQSDAAASHICIRPSRVGIEAAHGIHPSSLLGNVDLQTFLRSVDGVHQQNFPFGDPGSWELPFLQGWLMGQTHAGLNSMPPLNDAIQEDQSMNQSASELLLSNNIEPHLNSSAMPTHVSHSRMPIRVNARHRSRSRLIPRVGSGEGTTSLGIANDESNSQPGVGRIESEFASSIAAATASELPCTVKLRIWPHNMQNPCAPLDADKSRLTIPHAVLCSEMGAHFSPCGRFLAACVACVLPRLEVDSGLPSHVQYDATGVATSPTRHPLSAHQVMYELRVYSLENATFGSVLASRAIRAAHCLTSIQFSPTSEHILLAYGRRHGSLLRTIVVDGKTAVPVYTILEVYRVSDMELVSILPSAEDEVNVACFHPSPGGGLVYGTKEGKLRILQYDSANAAVSPCKENILEVPTYALEC